jgi:hypothetical protein
MSYLTDPATADAFVARRGVELCLSMAFSGVIFEGDAQVVVSALLAEGDGVDTTDCIIADTRQLLRTFPQWRASFTRREGNAVAHLQARMAVKQRFSKVLMASFPDSILDAVCKDLGSYSDIL